MYHLTIHIASIQPSLGISGQNTTIFVVGHHFFSFEALQCSIGDFFFGASFVSTSVLRCVANIVQPGTYSVALNFDHVISSESCTDFEVVRMGRILETAPTKGTTSGGDTISIIGTDLDSRLQYSCSFGGRQTLSLTSCSQRSPECRLERVGWC